MADFQMYLFAAVILAGVVAFWYFTKGTALGRKALPWLAIGVVAIVVLLSFRSRIPFVSSLISWVKDKFADKRIAELEKDITRLKSEKDSSIKESDEYKAKAKELESKASDYYSQVKAMDDIVDKRVANRNAQKDPGTLAAEALPEMGSDPIENSVKLTEALAKRRAQRKVAP
jgi:hypothetical protein